MSAKAAAIVVGVIGGGAGAYLLITKKYNLWPFQLPPGKFILTVKSKAGTTEVSGVSVTVGLISDPIHVQGITTPGSATLDTGDYTLVVPEAIVDSAGDSYSYQSYEET